LFSRRTPLGNKPDLIAQQVLHAFVPDPMLRPVRDAPRAPAKRAFQRPINETVELVMIA